MIRMGAHGWMRVVILSVLAGVSRVAAQDPTAQPPAAEEPAHPAWHGSLSLGLAVANGIQSQRSIQLDGDLLRPFSDGGRFVAGASRQYQNVTFPSAALLSDRTNIAVGVDQNLTKNTVVMVRSLYLKDSQLLIISRFEELFGYGLHLYDKTKKRIDFELVPGLSIYNEDLSYADDSGWKSGIGFYEKFSGKFDKVWSFSNSFRFRNDFSDSNRSVESSASLEGMITKSLGLQIGYQYNYESIVPDTFPSFLSMLSAGLKFQF